MKPLPDRIRRANELLQPFAVPHGGELGRKHPEHADATRFPFQRDRDRIIHTQAFRRLKHKTQVFVSGHGDHYRTRMTHTMEVAQISRDIARTLGLNEDLAESIALAHDLGHTPFGHAGEEAMRQCLKPCGKTFEHNEQSLRVVGLLEERTTKYHGLNLNREILEGLMRHQTSHDRPGRGRVSRSSSLEAQIVNLADEIAYTAHDTDDGIRAKLFGFKDVARTALGRKALKKSRSNGTELRGALVGLLVSDLYLETEKRLRRQRIQDIDDVYAADVPLVVFSPSMVASLGELRRFLWDHLYLSSSVQRQARRGKQVIKKLFKSYLRKPPEKVLDLMKKTGSELPDAVKDFIAGMTDPFALETLKLLTVNS
ncbi:MAG: dNTP triphosphohydrolase [Candidatus Peribacteraceae bacterium]